jgi:Restriction endonuclease
MSIAEKFRWNAINDEQFEELVFKVLKSANPQQIELRKGPGDKGRDIEVQFRRQDALGDEVNETYFVEVKHYQKGVPSDAFKGALVWASSKKPQVLLIVVSSHLTTSCRDCLKSWHENNPNIRVPSPWEREEIENKILQSSEAREYAISLGLLPPFIQDLLPPSPETFRISEDETIWAMEYRYWITEEEVEKIGYVVELLGRLQDAIRAECGSHKYFEDVCLAIPNWSTFLTLLQPQLRLQIAIRDYLFALNSDVPADRMNGLVGKIKEYVELVRQVGDGAKHID